MKIELIRRRFLRNRQPYAPRLHIDDSMKLRIVALLLVFFTTVLSAQENRFTAVNDVTWNSLGTNENNSMPIGNGDIALNVWTEQNGDIVLLLAKSDAWSENGQLLKLGRVRVKLTPNPFTAASSFTQTLKLETGEVQIQAGKSVARIWVDANHPVIHLEVEAESPVQLEAKSELWRIEDLSPRSAGGFAGRLLRMGQQSERTYLWSGHDFAGAKQLPRLVPLQFQQHLPAGFRTGASGIAAAQISGPAPSSLLWPRHERPRSGEQ